MSYLFLLEGDSRKSKGKVDQVVRDITNNPPKIVDLIPFLNYPDIIVQIRTSNVLLSLSKAIPESINKHKREILSSFFTSPIPEVQWQLAQLLNILDLSKKEQNNVKQHLKSLIKNKHKFLIAHSMEALADHLIKYELPTASFSEFIKQMTVTGSPALQARGRKILKKFQR